MRRALPLAALVAVLVGATPLTAAAAAGSPAAGSLVGVAAERLVLVRATPGVEVPRAEHVLDDWWRLLRADLPSVRAELRAALQAVTDVGELRVAGTPVPSERPTIRPRVVEGDPDSDLQWHLPQVEVPAAWQDARGAGARVAVLDSGITPGPDLQCRTFVGEFDATTRTAGPAEDGTGHGTHVAGTVAQCSDNGIGTAGVAPDADLLDVKVLGADPDDPGAARVDEVALGLSWAAEQGAGVINLSLTAPCTVSRPTWEAGCREPVLDAAIAEAVEADVLVVAAAGNDGGPVGYPANHPDVLAVGATGTGRSVPPYSSRGPGLDVVAPGGIDGDADGDGSADLVYQESVDVERGDHAVFGIRGTSMAAPHVSGIAALLRSAVPDADAEQVRDVLVASACDIGLPGPDPASAAGIVQARNALRVLADTGAAPTCFADVPPGSALAAEVLEIARRGITVGCDPLSTRYCPRAGVTRGQLAALLARALELPAVTGDRFDDDRGSPYADAIESLAAAGIVAGCGERAFCPTAEVTRAQAAAMLVAAFQLPDVEGDSFSDDDGSVFEPAIESLADAGVTRGCTGDEFCGTRVVDRQQVAAFLVRSLERAEP